MHFRTGRDDGSLPVRGSFFQDHAGPIDIGVDATHRFVDDVLHTDRRGQMVDLVHASDKIVHQRLVQYGIVEEAKPVLGQQVLDVGHSVSREVVHHQDVVALGHEEICQMGADEARSAGNENPHCLSP
jgi:hypothetical protein